jgi:hypothetical protein
MNQFDSSSLYDRYRVTIKIRERICGGTPRDRAMIEAWVKARTGHNDDETLAQIAEAESVTAAAETAAEKMWCGFPTDERGLFVWSRQIKALLRECATVLGITKAKRGSRQIVQHGFEIVGPDHASRVYLGVKEPTGTEERAIHVMTAQGPRTALKREDFVEGCTLSFEVRILKTAAQETRHLGEAEVTRMITFAQENGLGASRSQGHGKFDVIEFEKSS